MGNFFRNIHPLLRRDKRKDEYDDTNFAVLNALNYELTQAEQETLESKIQSSLETATGDYLDTWGDWFGVYRKDGWDDDYYRGRITRYLLLKRSTIPAIIDALVDFLNDNDAHIEIYEPWKNIFYTNKSKLNGEDHMMGYYYRFAIIDISIDRPFPPEIIEVVKAFKPAGVLFYIRLDNSKNPNTKVIKDPYSFVDVSNKTELELWNGLTYDVNGNMNLMDSDPQAVTNNIFYTNKSMLNGEDVLAGSFTHGRSHIHLASTLALSDYTPTKESTLSDAKLAIGESNPDLYLQTKDTDDRSASATVKISSAEYHKAYANSADGKDHFSNDFFINDLNAEITSAQASLLEQGEDIDAKFTVSMDGKYGTGSRHVLELPWKNNYLVGTSDTWQTKTFSGWASNSITINVGDSLVVGDTITISGEIDATLSSIDARIPYTFVIPTGSNVNSACSTVKAGAVGVSYRTVVIPEGCTSIVVGIAGRVDGTTSVTIGARKHKVVKGEYDANDQWSPAPEDVGVVHGQQNVFSLNTVTLGQFPSWYLSDLLTNKERWASDFIAVSPSEVYSYKKFDTTTNPLNLVFKLYDNNNNGVYLANNSSWVVPSGAGVNVTNESGTLPPIPDGVTKMRIAGIFRTAPTNLTLDMVNSVKLKVVKGDISAIDEWTPSQQDFEGKENILTETSGTWQQVQLSVYDERYVNKTLGVDYVVGDKFSVMNEFDNTKGSSGVYVQIQGLNSTGGTVSYANGSIIAVGASGVSKVEYTVPNDVQSIRIKYIVKRDAVTSSMLTRNTKAIKGGLSMLGLWIPKDRTEYDKQLGYLPLTTDDYNNLNSFDKLVTSKTYINNRGAEVNLNFNVVGYLEKEIPTLFSGLVDSASKKAKFLEKTKKVSYKVKHKGSGVPMAPATLPNNARAYMHTISGSRWGTGNTANTTANLITYVQDFPSAFLIQVQDDGVYRMSETTRTTAKGNADGGVVSNGVTPAVLEVSNPTLSPTVTINKSLFKGREPKYVGYSKKESSNPKDFKWEVYNGSTDVDTTKIFAVFNTLEFIKNNYAKEFELLKNKLGNDEALNTLFNEFDISTSLRALVPTTDAVHTRIQIFDFQANNWYELDSRMLDLNKISLNLPVNQVVSYLNDNGLMFIRYTFDCKESREATVELDMLNILFNYRMGDGYSLGLQSKAESWTEIAVSSLTLSKTDTFIAVGATEQLTATISPETATFHKVDWVSADETIATVDSNGVITGVHEGTTAITAYGDQKEIKTNCTVDVYYPVTDITASAESVDLSFKLTTPATDVITASEAVNITIKGENANG